VIKTGIRKEGAQKNSPWLVGGVTSAQPTAGNSSWGGLLAIWLVWLGLRLRERQEVEEEEDGGSQDPG